MQTRARPASWPGALPLTAGWDSQLGRWPRPAWAGGSWDSTEAAGKGALGTGRSQGSMAKRQWPFVWDASVRPSVRLSVLLHSVRCVPRPKPRKAVLLCDAVTFTGAHFVRSPCSLIVRDLVSDWPPPPLCPHASPGGSLCPRQVAGPAAGRAHVAAAAAPGTCASAGALLC